MRHTGKGKELRQDTLEARPIFKILEEPKPVANPTPENKF
jgi:hypothetical protein